MRRTVMVIGVLAASMALAACSSDGGATTGGTGGTIEGVDWVLTSYDENGTQKEVPADVYADARFQAGKVSGSAGCNQYNGAAKISGVTLAVTGVSSTMMACPPPASDVETAFLAALNKSASFTATADSLTIFDTSGAKILVFSASTGPALTEGEWHVTGYNNGKQAVVSVAAGSDPTAVFGADGTVSGNATCNRFNGTYTIDGDKIAISQLATTMMACETDELNAQEAAYLAALQSAATYQVRGSTLDLRTASDALAVTYTQPR
jgi:heat shock protein HslJ